MNEWASSPWSTNDNTTTSTSTSTLPLSPAPRSFARTSPSLTTSYFDALPNDNAAIWGTDAVTPVPVGVSGTLDEIGKVNGNGNGNGFDVGKASGNVADTAEWTGAGLASPRPIASPGRVANGRGNWWVRPSLGEKAVSGFLEDEGFQVEEERVRSGDNGGEVVVMEDVDGTVSVDGGRMLRAGFDGTMQEIEDVSDLNVNGGLGISMDTAGKADEVNGYGMHDDNEEPKSMEDISRSVDALPDKLNHTNDQDETVVNQVASIEKEQDVKSSGENAGVPADDFSTYAPTQSAPSIEFSVDLSLISKIFPTRPPISPSEPDSPFPDTIITKSSARKAHYRITRPYSLRQYNSGNFETYHSVTWPNSAVHQKTVDFVAAWIAKDRAIGGGVFDVSTAKSRVGFGWGGDGNGPEKKPTVSASSIVLPKIAGPNGAFGWSSAAMTPLKPVVAGVKQVAEVPKASQEVAGMQPRPRRTPIRKPRVVSTKSPKLAIGLKDTPAALFDELAMFDKPTVVAGPELPSVPQQTIHTVEKPDQVLGDDFDIFEGPTNDDFQEFAIAPPPMAPLDLAAAGMLDEATEPADNLHDLEPVVLPGVEEIVKVEVQTKDKEEIRSTLDNIIEPLRPPTGNLEKEALFEENFSDDDFEPFASASPIEAGYTDSEPVNVGASNDINEVKTSQPFRYSDAGDAAFQLDPQPERQQDLRDMTEPSSKENQPEAPVNHEPISASAIGDALAAPSPSPAPAPQSDMLYDDFSMFEEPLPRTKRSEPNVSVFDTTANHTAHTSAIAALSSSSTVSVIPSDQNINPPKPDMLQDNNDDDDFGDFEEAVPPVDDLIRPSMATFDLPLQPEILASTNTVAMSAPISRLVSVQPPQNTTNPSQPQLNSISSMSRPLTPSQTPPPQMTQQQPPRPLSAPITNTTTTLRTLPTKSIAPPHQASANKSTHSTKSAKSAKPVKPKDNDTGASILNILAFLDAAEDAQDPNNEDDDDISNGRTLYDQHPAEAEALAGEKMVRRLRREEWVGERPDLSRHGKGGDGAGSVDERFVESVVRGLPDWGFMLK